VPLAAADPATTDIAAFLPAIAHETSIPVDFLEAAAGIAATRDIAADPGLFGQLPDVPPKYFPPSGRASAPSPGSKVGQKSRVFLSIVGRPSQS
jgi:hypothetical protein